MIVEIKLSLKTMRITISIEHMRSHTKVKRFEDDPLPFLINECYNKVEVVRRKLERGEIQPNID